uniref:Glycosyltransferase RgtA/B/C/D-like domain-containing protein n=1 Tax=Ignisphaera aggregans TaxID=334771 RepID=A0A7J2U438_9CREN
MALTTKYLYVFLVLGIIGGYAFLGYYYYKGLLSLDQYLKASFAALLSLILAIILSSRHKHQKIDTPGLNIGEIAYVIPYMVFISSTMDVCLFRHLDIFSILSLILALTILTLSKHDLGTSLLGITILATIIVTLYGIYTPSFGNDTWRDVTQASQIIERGGLRDLTMVHEAYPFPLVSLLYAIYGIVAGSNILWSSSTVGVVYLLLLILWIHVLSYKLNTGYHRVASLLALSTPLVIVWSVWFIPQAYALLMALPLLFLKLHIIIVTILTLALVFGHGGMALWTLGVFIVLFIFMKMIKAKTSAHTFLQQLNIKLALFLIIFSIYATYTVILMVLKGAVTNVFEAVMAFLRGERILIAAPSIQAQAPITSILGVIPIAILVTLGLVRILEDNDILLRLLVLVSLAGLAVAYVGAVAFPALDLPRYLGLGSIILLAMLSPQAFESLTRRGKLGAGYAYALLLLAILSFGFTGTLMPENPYTANPYLPWSMSGLITYDEAQELRNLAPLFCCNNFLIDWRAGAYLGYKYLWIQPWYRGFRNLNTGSLFIFAGSYGLLITPKYLEQSKEILIFRRSAFEMPEAYSTDVLKHIYLMIYKQNTSVYYFSGNFIILKLNSD